MGVKMFCLLEFICILLGKLSGKLLRSSDELACLQWYNINCLNIRRCADDLLSYDDCVDEVKANTRGRSNWICTGWAATRSRVFCNNIALVIILN